MLGGNPNSKNSSSSNGDGDGDGKDCTKSGVMMGGARCELSLQLRLYRATIFATPLIFALVLLTLLCMLCFRRRTQQSGGALLRPQFMQHHQHQHQHQQSFAMGILSRLILVKDTTGRENLETPVPPREYGLSKSFRESLPVMPYNDEVSSSFQGSLCAVCLGDYQLDEKIKKLPTCNHYFHVHCIDKWLSANVTCPLCREEIGYGSEPRDGNRTWVERVIQNQGHSTNVNDLNEIGTIDMPSTTLSNNEVVVLMDRS